METTWDVGETGGLLPRVGQGEDDGERGLNGKVDGEDGGLERGDLRAGEGAVGAYAADKGLEDLGAEEGSVAGREMRFSQNRIGGLGIEKAKRKWQGKLGSCQMREKTYVRTW